MLSFAPGATAAAVLFFEEEKEGDEDGGRVYFETRFLGRRRGGLGVKVEGGREEEEEEGGRDWKWRRAEAEVLGTVLDSVMVSPAKV